MSEFNLFSSALARVSDLRLALRARELFDQILFWLRGCAHCGSIELGMNLFCEPCATQERRERLVSYEQEGYHFPVRSLYRWVDEGLVRSLVYSQKRGWAVGAAREWMEALSLEPRLAGEKIRFVYPTGGRRDHAWLLAEILSEIWNASRPLALELIEQKRGPQHTLNVEERAWRRFKPPAALDIADSGVHWVFVDDVITSGASAMGAFMALGDPEHFEVWTLACRPKLAGKSRFW